MFYVSPALTTLMLALVPPVSLGVVRPLPHSFARALPLPGVLWSLPQEVIEPNPGSPRGNEQGQNKRATYLRLLSNASIGCTGVTGCASYRPGL